MVITIYASYRTYLGLCSGTSKCIDSTLFDVQAYVVHNQHNVMSKQNAKTLKETKADFNKSLLVQVTIEEY